MGTSSALVVQDTNSVDHIYLIDLGPGSAQQLGPAFNSGTFTNVGGNYVQVGYSSFLKNVKALFFTHLHMDHTTDLPTLLLCGQGAGLTAYPDDEADKRLQVYGPGTRGQLDDIYPFGRTNVAQVINPTNPTPGTVDMTQYLLQAYSQTINNFTRDSGWGDFSQLLSVHDIALPPLPRDDYPIDPATGQSRNTAPWPDMAPILIYQDPFVRVTATLGNHGPVYANFAYRFDTADGSVVFSGDTGYPCNNLIQLAQGADILVHEVIDTAFIDNLFPPPLSDSAAALKYHLETAHTAISNVGKHATAAGVGTLVLNHIVPANTAEARLQQAQQGYAGRLIVGSDLMEIDVGTSALSFNPVAADFDGDAKADPAIVISGNWYVWLSGMNYARTGPHSFTGSDWTPLAGDFDGDRLADPSGMDATGNWFIRFSSFGYLLGGAYPRGDSLYVPVAGDFDGDAYADTGGLNGSGNWYFWMSSYAYLCEGPYPFGGGGLMPHAGDFDGDRLADPAADNGSGNWYVWFSTAGYLQRGPYQLGSSGLAMVAADLDGDSIADTAGTNGAGTWYFWLSASGYSMVGPVTLSLP
jgi:ribonuclease BN (tRNA processing enzyme)